MFDKVLGIHGVPRSGTSWCAQLFNSNPKVKLKFQPLFSYAFKSRISQNSTKVEIDQFFSEIFESEDYFINMRDPEIHKNYPIFSKSQKTELLVFKHVRYHYILKNLLAQEPNSKLVLIIRNPIEVLNSWINAPREFYPDWKIKNEWKTASLKNQNRPEEYFGYEKWKEAALLFHDLKKEFPNRVYLLEYSQLENNTLSICKKLFDFSGLIFTEETYDFIIASKKRNDEDPNSVFKSKDRRHTSKIPNFIILEIQNDLKNSELAKYLS